MSTSSAQENRWTPPTTAVPIRATVQVPGSKSITNRAYVLAALAEEPTTIRKPLRSRDTRLMSEALGALGAGCLDSGPDTRIRPLRAANRRQGSATVSLGNAGTVARFTPALAAFGQQAVLFDGDEAIRRRPIAPLLRALSDIGADIDDKGRGAPPFTVRGRSGLTGGTVELDSSSSSQFLSALLLAAPASETGVTVRLVGATPPSEPHIDMTLRMLRRFGAAPQRIGTEFHVPPATLGCPEYAVEPDLSAAAPFLLAAAATDGTVRIPDWPAASAQPGDWLRSLLVELGADVQLDSHGLIVTGQGSIQGTTLDLHDVGELTPVIAALLCLADGPSVLTGVAHLRGHETDRLAALATELSARGAGVRQTHDGLEIQPAPLGGGLFHTYDDHRMVMAGAVLSLRAPGIQIENVDTVGKTFPGFVETWESMLAESTEDS